MPDLPVPVQTVDPTPSQIVALLTGGLKFGKSFGMPFPPLWRPVSSPKALTRLRMQVLIYEQIVHVGTGTNLTGKLYLEATRKEKIVGAEFHSVKLILNSCTEPQ